jgi:hypothetical protein
MKAILGYETRYFASSCGNIWSVKNNKFLKGGKDHGDYRLVNLCKDGITKTHKVHRLIAQAFIANPYNKPEVNHKNGIRHDNRVENLEWCTCSENNLHACRVLMRKRPRSMLGKFGKLSHLSKKVYQYSKENILVGSFDGVRDASRQTGISRSDIGNCALGKLKTAGGYVWKYHLDGV